MGIPGRRGRVGRFLYLMLGTIPGQATSAFIVMVFVGLGIAAWGLATHNVIQLVAGPVAGR